MTGGMMPGTRHAKGYQEPNGQVQIAVRLPKALFEEMKRFAVKDQISIAAKIRDYIDVGVQVDIDMEEDAAPPRS